MKEYVRETRKQKLGSRKPNKGMSKKKEMGQRKQIWKETRTQKKKTRKRKEKNTGCVSG